MKKQAKQGTLSLSNPFKETGGEKLLQYIWQFGYYNKSNLQTSDGESITVVSPGTCNKNQGPDFLNARVKIGNTILAGNIELHLQTSDWKKHQHESDQTYKNVVLHVVYEHNEKVNHIPVLELSSRISNLLLVQYMAFMNNASFLPCGSHIQSINDLVLASWKERLLVERLTRKSAHVMQLYNQSNHHWEETLWWLLARNFGGKINGDAFEALALSIPVIILAKHKHSIHQIEAILFGQANLLNEKFEEDYPQLLQREYLFLRKKYNLQPSALPMLFHRMRPGNFPTIRLAQLAMLVYQTKQLFSTLIDTDKLSEIRQLFSTVANDFWHYHYTFKQTSGFKVKKLGIDTIDNIIINTVVPIVFSYGFHQNNEKYKDRALRWLEEVPSEANHITSEFERLGVKSQSAYDSQALIELKNVYCTNKKCLDCSVGNYLLREATQVYEVLNPAS